MHHIISSSLAQNLKLYFCAALLKVGVKWMGRNEQTTMFEFECFLCLYLSDLVIFTMGVFWLQLRVPDFLGFSFSGGKKTNPLWGYCLNKEGIIVLVLWSSEAIIVKKAYYVYMYYVGNIIMASSLAAVMQLIKPRLA